MAINNTKEFKFCVNCLTQDENVSLKCYELRNSMLKSLFQTESLTVCYLCSKILHNTEVFVHNVCTNQKYLENHRDITETVIQETKSQPIISLSLWHNNLEVNPDDDMEYDSFVVYGTGSVRDTVKLEVKNEVTDYLEDDFSQNDDFDTHIKEEDLDVPLIQLAKTKRKYKKKEKCTKKKIKVQKINDTLQAPGDAIKCIKDSVEYIRMKLTKAQCMEERQAMANEEQFKTATYKCMDCIKWFLYRNGLDKHMLLHDKVNGEYKCDICKQYFDTYHKLSHHRSNHIVRYKCTVCGHTRNTFRTIRDHYVVNHTAIPRDHFTCPQCQKTFKQQGSLQKHIDAAHRNVPTAQCDLCKKIYKNKICLKAHLVRKHGSELSDERVPSRRHECPECGKTFPAPSLLRLHMPVHSTVRDYYCVECDKSFKSEAGLKQHYKIAQSHANTQALSFGCDMCERRFRCRRDLIRHKYKDHLQQRPFQCDKCDKSYLTNWTLMEHKRRAHEGVKRPYTYPCPMCDKVFNRNTTMRMHLRTHTGERPYKCTKCPAEFGQAGVRNTHVKLVHLKLAREPRPRSSVTVA